MRSLIALAARLLRKADQGDADVERIIRLLELAVARHWERRAEEMARDCEARIRALADELPTPDVDVLVDEPRRKRVLDDLIAGLILALEQRAEAPLPAGLQATIRDAARALMAGGAGKLALPGGGTGVLAFDEAAVQAALTAAERDLPLMLAGRVAERSERLADLLERVLTSRTARLPGTGAPGLADLPGAPLTWEGFGADLRALLGVEARTWANQVVTAWAYRWNSVGTFLAARAAGVALFVVNNPPKGPDSHTTPFCSWVHGRRINMNRAALQIDRYVRAVGMGDREGAIAAWPLLIGPRVLSSDANDNAVSFAMLGLPPYHWLCRDIVLAEVPSEG